MPKVYIDEFVGISNRLEALPLAFAIQKQYGHEIILDWSELDSFSVEGTRQAKIKPWHKLGARRLRDCSLSEFRELSKENVICRSLDGPSEYLDQVYLEVAARVKAATFVVDGIVSAFEKHSHRPVIGVHVRQGDYQLVEDAVYSINTQYPAVPVWWYYEAMHKAREIQPNAIFFLAHNGSANTLARLFDEFDVFQLDLQSPYKYKGTDHASRVNPVADLFALACCPTLLATPFSGYSHWAANVLGKPTTAIVPVPGCTSAEPKFARLDLYGKRFKVWRIDASRNGGHVEMLDDGWSGVDLARTADLSWIKPSA
ncbi:hypothetical protein [Limnobacter parvus]|uniref:Alpha-1,2-fucosyltransferase n=1 Tax=Limnobacter parvus TaxID=2939690 RepID=A0ABT1XET8_9BURK|nr:hypothetical protein [Limnobacter parvus]MCR2745792.1 hypothetical protein [Limnobacter parvus]